MSLSGEMTPILVARSNNYLRMATSKLVIFVMFRNAGGPLGTREIFSDGMGMEDICCRLKFKGGVSVMVISSRYQ